VMIGSCTTFLVGALASRLAKDNLADGLEKNHGGNPVEAH
jgi:hypothetical protein